MNDRDVRLRCLELATTTEAAFVNYSPEQVLAAARLYYDSGDRDFTDDQNRDAVEGDRLEGDRLCRPPARAPLRAPKPPAQSRRKPYQSQENVNVQVRTEVGSQHAF